MTRFALALLLVGCSKTQVAQPSVDAAAPVENAPKPPPTTTALAPAPSGSAAAIDILLGGKAAALPER